MVSVFIFPSIGYAASIKIPNYSSKGTFVQGSCVDDTEENIYVFKQNESKYGNLQKINLKTKKSKRINLSDAGRAAIHHGNDMCYIKIKKISYLLVAPGSNKYYIAIFKLTKSKAIYKGKIHSKYGVSGITLKDSSNGYIANSSIMKKIKINIQKKKIVSYKTIKGYTCNQGISLCGDFITGCKGGFYKHNGRIIKYKFKNNKLKKVFSKKVDGEPQNCIITTSHLYVVIEGKCKYHHYNDKIFITKT